MNVGVSSSPSALAVLRLTASSNLTGCSTSRSAGLVPCRPRAGTQIRRVGHQAAAGDHVDVGWTRHQLVRQPAAMFFSAAYFAAASLTMGAITLSSLTYQS